MVSRTINKRKGGGLIMIVNLTSEDIAFAIKQGEFLVDKLLAQKKAKLKKDSYYRGWKTRDEGIIKIMKGTLGEIALAKAFASMQVPFEGPYLLVQNGESYDMRAFGQRVEVKSKTFCCFTHNLPSPDTIFLHIYKPQYDRYLRTESVPDFIAVRHLLNTGNNTDSDDRLWWENKTEVETEIVGGLTFEEYDERKQWFQGGRSYYGAYIPKPGSWGVAYDELDPIGTLMLKLEGRNDPDAGN
jgi:hypothetical protein